MSHIEWVLGHFVVIENADKTVDVTCQLQTAEGKPCKWSKEKCNRAQMSTIINHIEKTHKLSNPANAAKTAKTDGEVQQPLLDGPQIMQRLAIAFARHGIAFCLMDDDFFRSALRPSLPASSYFIKQALEKMNTDIRAKVMELLVGMPWSINFDLGTTNNRKHLVIMLRSIKTRTIFWDLIECNDAEVASDASEDDDEAAEERLGKTSAVNLAMMLDQSLANLPGFCVAATSDNAANVVAACKLYARARPWLQPTRCTPHAINLLCKDLFESSPVYKSACKVCEEVEKHGIQLRQDTESRWWSTYLRWISLIKAHEEPVKRAVIDAHVSWDDLGTVKEAIRTLAPLHDFGRRTEAHDGSPFDGALMAACMFNQVDWSQVSPRDKDAFITKTGLVVKEMLKKAKNVTEYGFEQRLILTSSCAGSRAPWIRNQ
jgi:hypothetical protein